MLMEQTLQAEHGRALTELRELERAIEVAEGAVEAGMDEVRVEAGVFNVRKWAELSAPFKATAFVPWLRRRGDDIYVVPLDLENPQPTSLRRATPEEIEAGRYFTNLDAYRAANAA